jgi:DNA primase
MEHESLTYPDALKWLAKKYNIEIVEKEETEQEKQIKDERESMIIVSSYALKYYSRFLWKENEGRTIGLSYFRERGLRDDIIKKFELGYCPDGKSVFTDAAKKEGYKIEFLEKTGLTIKRDEWVRDRFAGRVMFPIHNLAGRNIAFGGRILKNDPKAAKYLNSPESEIYHKSRVLYGIYQAKREITRADKCYLVEGYTDVLALHQAGIENVVASSGTALTPDQIRLIKRFTPNITIIYDGDDAGIKASLRGIDLVLEEGMNVKVLLLPKGEDPDSFSRSRSSTEFLEYIQTNEADFIQFKTKLLLKSTENDPVAKARLISDVIRSVAVIPDTITRSVYLKECSSLLNVDEEVLYTEIRKYKRKQSDDLRNRKLREKPKNVVPPPKIILNHHEDLIIEERELLRLLIKYGKSPLFEIEEEHKEPRIILGGEFIIDEIESDGLVSEKSLFQVFFDEIKKKLPEPGFDPFKYFVNHPNEKISQLASDLLSEKHIESKRWRKAGAYAEKEEEILDVLIPKIINEYKLRKVKELLSVIEIDIDEASKLNDFDKIFEKQSVYMNLKKVEKTLSDKLGNRTFM